MSLFVLLPLSPTDEMLDAANEAIKSGGSVKDVFDAFRKSANGRTFDIGATDHDNGNHEKWDNRYDDPMHLAMDLRLIADDYDSMTSYPTLNAAIIRCAASCFDNLPVEISHKDAMDVLRNIYGS